jgi:PKD repeat protein
MTSRMRLVLSIVVTLATLTAGYLALGSLTAGAQGPTTRYVAPGGDCGGMSPCYAVVQNAVDAAANGDTIKISQGVYTSTAFQIAYINKAVSLIGGYATSDWVNSLPVTRSTVFDAEDVARRRGLLIDGTGVATITVAGLTIDRGHAESDSGGGVYILTGTVRLVGLTIQRSHAEEGAGGGVYILTGTVVLLNTAILSGTANNGGGMCVEDGNVSASQSTFRGNTAPGWNFPNGGAVSVHKGIAVLENNVFQGNSSNYVVGEADVSMTGNTFQSNTGARGAVSTDFPGGKNGTVTLHSNIFISNTSQYVGGGVDANAGTVVIITNTFLNNVGRDGGAVYVGGGNVTVQGNVFTGNRAEGGGAVSIGRSSPQLISNIITGNLASQYGGGVNMYESNVTMAGNTIVGNSAALAGGGLSLAGSTVDGQNDVIAGNVAPLEGVYVWSGALLRARHWTISDNGSYALTTNGATAALTNTIVTSHTLGGFAGINILADRTLFFTSGTPCSSGASCTNTLVGDPYFVDATTRDYHIAPGSAALNAGVNAGVTFDIDGDPRPMCSGYDIGADEFVPPAPAAAFFSSAPVWFGNSVIFTNTTVSTGCESYYLWDFGDGDTSTAFSPTHYYGGPGIYTAVLTATNGGGSSVATGTLAVYAAAFASSSPDWLGQTTGFTNTTVTSGTTSYQWSFGDSVSTDVANSPHDYALPGIYTVVLTATNAAGSGIFSDTVVVYAPPTAGFVASPLLGIRPLTVTFTNTSTTTPPGDPTVNYQWDFGDAVTGAWEDPTHVYTVAGTYTVSLVATNAAGSDAFTRTAHILVDHIPVQAGFTAWPTSGLVPLTVTFTNTSSGDYTVLLWSFGDGATATVTNPIHIYPLPGAYTVTLEASGPGGNDGEEKAGYITILHGIYLPVVLRAY